MLASERFGEYHSLCRICNEQPNIGHFYTCSSRHRTVARDCIMGMGFNLAGAESGYLPRTHMGAGDVHRDDSATNCASSSHRHAQGTGTSGISNCLGRPVGCCASFLLALDNISRKWYIARPIFALFTIVVGIKSTYSQIW